jgi:hypothetical protein
MATPLWSTQHLVSHLARRPLPPPPHPPGPPPSPSSKVQKGLQFSNITCKGGDFSWSQIQNNTGPLNYDFYSKCTLQPEIDSNEYPVLVLAEDCQTCLNLWNIGPQTIASITCSPTGMFALPNPMSHVRNAAFAQAQFRPSSASAQVCSGLLRSAHPYYATRRS